ncbi:MAG: hypothetical protein V7699_06845 [Porticoccus sp.]
MSEFRLVNRRRCIDHVEKDRKSETGYERKGVHNLNCGRLYRDFTRLIRQ